jgi:effector protein B
MSSSSSSSFGVSDSQVSRSLYFPNSNKLYEKKLKEGKLVKDIDKEVEKLDELQKGIPLDNRRTLSLIPNNLLHPETFRKYEKEKQELTEFNQRLEQDLMTCEEREKKLQQRLAENCEKLQLVESAKDQLIKELSIAKEEETNQLNQKIGEKDKEIDVLKFDSAFIRTQLRELTQSYGDLKQKYNETQIELNNLIKRIEEAEIQIKEQEKDIQDKDKQIEQREQELTVANEKIEELVIKQQEREIEEFVRGKLAEAREKLNNDYFLSAKVLVASAGVGAVNPLAAGLLFMISGFDGINKKINHDQIIEWMDKNLKNNIILLREEFFKDKEKTFEKIVKEIMMPSLNPQQNEK